MINKVETSSYDYWPLDILFSEKSVQVYSPFFYWVVFLFLIGFQEFFKHLVYKPLVGYMYADICFHFMKCLFTHFWWKEILNIILIYPNLSIFFMVSTFWVLFKKLCPTPGSEKCSPLKLYCFYFIVRSTIYLKFILFIVWSRGQGNFFHMAMALKLCTKYTVVPWVPQWIHRGVMGYFTFLKAAQWHLLGTI